VQAASADTIVFKDDTTMNGAVKYTDGVFEVSGRWQGSARVGRIAATFVKAVRPNSLEDNASPPPEFPLPRGNQRVSCEVLLAGESSPRTGTLDLIDDSRVRVNGADIERKRITLIRIVRK
jgi:hypothetical protein